MGNGYGGAHIDLRELPAGTNFWVYNGCWSGTIIEIEGNRLIKHNKGTIPIGDSYKSRGNFNRYNRIQMKYLDYHQYFLMAM